MHPLPRRIGPHARFSILGIAFWALVVPGGAQARIWKCVDADGHVSYVGSPCPEGASPLDTFDEERWRRPAPVPPGSPGLRAPSDGSGEPAEVHPSPDGSGFDDDFDDDFIDDIEHPD